MPPCTTSATHPLAGGAILLVGLLAGCAPRGGAPQGDFTSGAAATLKNSQLRAVTFNLYNRPWERAGRLRNTVETLKRLDANVICLQEVATGWILADDPAELLARELKMSYVRYWHEENLGIFRTGIAVLSRFPIAASEYHEFARHGFWDAKGYMLTRLTLPGGSLLQLVNLHMASTTDDTIRKSEWQELTSFVQKLQSRGPVLIAGDFNTEPADPALIEFARQPGARSLYDGWKNISEMRSWTPDYRDSCAALANADAQLIDYFFALPGAPGASGALSFAGGRIALPGRAPHPSDHCPVMAELSVGM